MDTVRLSGVITDGDGQPVAEALVRFVAGIDTLGAVPQAVVSAPTAVVWTKPVTGYTGKLWNAYRKFVAGEVAGLTFADFKLQVVQHNPSLAGDAFIFHHDQVYLMPANDPPALETSWDRPLTGFRGTVRECWTAYVAGKVIGMPWDTFKSAMVKHNPGLGRDGVMLPDRTYRLPHHNAFVEYEVATTTSASGRYVMPHLVVGDYRVDVVVDGRLRSSESLTVTAAMHHNILIAAPMAFAGPPPGFVRAVQGEFRLNDQGFGRFVGVNLPHLLHYGDTGVLQFSAVGHQREALSKAKEARVRVIRTFVPHHRVATQDVVNRLEVALGLMEEFDMYLLPAFIDLYSNSGAFPQTTDLNQDYLDYRDNSGNSVRLSDLFFRSRYKAFYLDFIETIVKKFASHRRIFAWEIGNEMKSETLVVGQNPDGSPSFAVRGNPDEFVTFNLDVARKIREWDGGFHMVTTGMLCSRQAWMESRPDLVRKLYGTADCPIDFVTVHAYEQGADVDATWAFEFKRPLLVEEAGIPKDQEGFGDRLNSDLRHWFEQAEFSFPNGQTKPRQRAAGYLLWQFDPLHIGEGGGNLHDDFNVIREQFVQFA